MTWVHCTVVLGIVLEYKTLYSVTVGSCFYNVIFRVRLSLIQRVQDGGTKTIHSRYGIIF